MENNKIPPNANDDCPGPRSQNAGKQEQCQGCPNQQQCSSGQQQQEDPALEEIKKKLSQVKNIILILSGKGGVGKSTISTQLALTLSKLNEDTNVGLLDIDICGPSVPKMLNLIGQEVHQSNQGWSPVYLENNLAVMSIGFLLPNQDDAVIWRGPRKNGLIKQFLTDVIWEDLDYLIIDTPPGTSDEHISIIQYLKKVQQVQAIIITTPQEVSLSDVRKEINFCFKTDTKILGVIENMSEFLCPHCFKGSQIFEPTTGGATKMCKDFNIPLLCQIPLEPKLMMSCESGKSYIETSKDSIGAKRLLQLVEQINQMCNKQD